MVTEKTLHKLAILGGQSFDDREGPPGFRKKPKYRRKFLASDTPAIFPVPFKGGRIMPLLSTMMTNACSYDCHYCPMRASRNMPRYAFSPEELADAFMALKKRNRAEGLFLTSGVPGSGVTGVDRMIAAAEILRFKHHFHGYIHLKMLPGVEDSQLSRAAQIATRLSVNLEAATQRGLHAMAPEKSLETDLKRALQYVGTVARESYFERTGLIAGGVTTQFIVGASGESDMDVLAASHSLQKKGLLRHTHFSAFKPVEDTPMDGVPSVSKTREHRLYQAEHLLREYEFGLDEIPASDGNLALDEDPKTTWARRNLSQFPVEIMTADPRTLMRVPGIGPTWAKRLVEVRRKAHIRDFRDLTRLGRIRKSAAGWLALRGKRLGPEPVLATQMSLDLRHRGKRRVHPSMSNLPPCSFR